MSLRLSSKEITSSRLWCGITSRPLFLVAVVLGILSPLPMLLVQKEDFLYRARTAFTAMIEVGRLPEKVVQDFIEAFSMFDMNNFSGTPEEMKLVEAYYNVLPHLSAIGNYEKMYMPPLSDTMVDTYSNQKIFEKWMAKQLEVSSGDHVLDIGCGRGRIAHLVATETGAHVTGINIAKDQLESARNFANQTGMDDLLEFVHGNYNHRLTFPDGTFDAVYYVQVIGGYGTNLRNLFKEAFRVLKPGSRMVLEDYILLPAYNNSNETHRELMKWSRSVLGGVDFFPDEAFMVALKEAGFHTVSRRNHSVAPQVQLLRQDVNFFVPLGKVVSALAYIGLVPQHFKTMLDRLNQGTDGCITAHEIGVLTGDIVTVAEKPL